MIGHDKHKPELPDTNAEDHAYDAIAYACLSRPWVPIRKRTEHEKRWQGKTTERSAWTY